MINYKEVPTTEHEIVSFQCNICGKVYDAGGLEIQEFHHIRFCGGYGSVFGDGNEINGQKSGAVSDSAITG